MIQGLTTQNAPRAIGPYSQAMICDDLLFCSGQTPIDPQTMGLVGNDIVPQMIGSATQSGYTGSSETNKLQILPDSEAGYRNPSDI